MEPAFELENSSTTHIMPIFKTELVASNQLGWPQMFKWVAKHKTCEMCIEEEELAMVEDVLLLRDIICCDT